MHVLIFPSWYKSREKPFYGSFIRDQAKALNKSGVKVGVVYPEVRSIRNISLKGIKKNRFNFGFKNDNGILTLYLYGWSITKIPKLGERFLLWQFSLLVSKYIKKFGKPDIFHAHVILWGGVAAREAAKKYKIPFVITEHSTIYQRKRIRQRYIPDILRTVNSSSQIITVSNSLANQLSPYMNGKSIKVIPNVVDTDFFTLPSIKRKNKPFYFLTVAFLMKKKAIDNLILAFTKIFKGREDIILEIGGDGDDRARLEYLVNQNKMNKQIKFLGILSRKQVRNAIWKANIFVLPSNVETFGIVLIEAMSTGIPVIATISGGPEEFVKPKVGILVEPGNIEKLALSLLEMYNNYSSYSSNKKLIRNYAVENFSQNKVAQELITIYNKIIKSNQD